MAEGGQDESMREQDKEKVHTEALEWNKIIDSQIDKTKKESFIDGLTGLHNRQFIEEALEKTVLRSEREDFPLALMFVDLDGLKQINDTYGHAAGDKALKKIANGMKKALRKGDDVGRWGGDEFVMILKDFNPNDDELVDFFTKLKDAINGEGVKASFGLARWEKGINRDELIKRADQAMYKAKAKPGSIVEWEKE